MINQSILFQAKSFLCWERCPGLSIKLVPIQETVAFFYPPQSEVASVVLFYKETANNLTDPLCLLFHEAGHYLQWLSARKARREEDFTKFINLDKGKEKIDFEREAWKIGQEMLIEFLNKEKLEMNLVLAIFFEIMNRSLQTYHD